MKLFKIVKNSDSSVEFFFLGIKLYKKWKIKNFTKHSFLFGIIKFDYSKFEKRFYFLRIKIFTRIDFEKLINSRIIKLTDIVSQQNRMNQFFNYQVLNKIKEVEIKNKFQSGKKIKVFFVIAQPSKFCMDTVYKEMLDTEYFEPYIYSVYYDHNDSLDLSFREMCIENYNYFKNKGYNTILGYDQNSFEPLPLYNYEPDIVFINDPYLWRYTEFKNNILNFNYLLCYIPYGMNIVNNFFYHYDFQNINEVWRNFVPNTFDYNCQISRGFFSGMNNVSLGYPKLDDYKKEDSEILLPEKINNGKKIVIYAPHWSVKDGSNNIATFHLYYNLILDLVKENPSINFVFKPHPNLRLKIKQLEFDLEIMSLEDYDNYINEWNSLENGLVVGDENYIDLFKKSTMLITDSGSFIGEYAFSGHPCLYLVNPDTRHFKVKKESFRDKYNEFGRLLIDTYHLCFNSEDIIENFYKVVNENFDPGYATRMEIIKHDQKNIGIAGKNIVNYLINIFSK